MICPTCNSPTISRHDDRIDAVIVACRYCKRYTVEGSNTWLTAGPGMLAQLKRLAEEVIEEKMRMERFLHSPITDPIWERIDV